LGRPGALRTRHSGGVRHIVYVGETANEKNRVAAARIIASHLRDGWWLYYRAQAMPSKAAAKRMQDSLLGRYDYDWNILVQGD